MGAGPEARREPAGQNVFMAGRTSTRLAPIASGAVVGLIGLATAIAAANSPLPRAPQGLVVAADLAVGWTFALVGAVLWLRYASSRIGALTVLVGLASFLADIRWFGTDLAWTAGSVLTDAHLIALAWVLLAFPTGRLAAREAKMVSGIAGYFFVLAIAGHLFEDPLPGCAVCPDNLLLIRSDPQLSDLIWGVGQVINLVLVGVLVWLVVSKWRAASPVARRALAPVMWALWPIGAALGAAFLEQLVGFGTAGATAVLVAERLALLVFPIGLLFGMLRTRLDRARIGDLALRVGEVLGSVELETTIGEALGDPSARLGFWGLDGVGLIDVRGRRLRVDGDLRTISIPSADGEEIGMILCDPAVDDGLGEAVAATASLALRNESLRAELRRKLLEVEESRGRIAEAAVTERRKIERDLHDGAQQSLLALGASLGSIRGRVDGSAAAMLDEAIGDLRSIVEELRELARGVHPAILTERGLAPALETLAERAPLPVSVRVTGPRCRPASEAAVYFLVAEAITNASRHADATAVDVSVEVVDGWMRVNVSDDGRGGADPVAGSGIAGLQDRLAALGGSLTLNSPAGGGTVLLGAIPCE